MLKKIISIITVFCAVFALVGCGEETSEKTNSKDTVSHSVNILAFAEKGEIPEVPFGVGAEIDKVKSDFKATIDPASEIEDLIIDEGETTVWMDGGNSMFCYEKANESSGVGVIIAKEYAYDLSLGGVYTLDDVIELVGSEEYTRKAATEADAFYLPVLPETAECLSYTAGSYVLKFIAIDGYLSAVTITNPTVWNY
jgi:hypothetical protein